MKTYAVLLAILLPSSAQAAVQVYVGYLDQETSGVVSTLLYDQPNRKVLAIGAGLEEGNVFGLNYGAKPKVTDISPPMRKQNHGADDFDSGKKPSGGFIHDIFGSDKGPASPAPTGASADVVNAIRDAGGGTDRPTGGLQVAEFQKGSGKKDLLVVIRTPMNGRDPDALSRFLNVLLPALATLPQASASNGGIRLSSYGTAGGIDSRLSPGETAPVKASLFVGALPHGVKYSATLQYAQLGTKAAPLILCSNDFSSKLDAEEAARQAFFSWSSSKQGKIGDTTCSSTDSSGNNLQSAILASPGTSLSTSFFAGPDIKFAAAKLALSNVNMEDFQLIRFLNSDQGAPYRSAVINRVIADPPVLPANANNAVRDWYANARYPVSKYKEAIQWGLADSRIENPPESARWEVFAKLAASDTAKYVSQIDFKTGKGTLDPFYYDISRGFLYSAIDANLHLDGFTANLSRGLSSSAKKQLDTVMHTKADEVRDRAEDVQHANQDHHNPSDPAVAHAIDDLIASVQGVRVNQEPLRSELARKSNPVNPPDGDINIPLLADPKNPGKMRVWVNAGDSFDDCGGSSPPDVAHEIETTNEAINRSLYKLSLIGLAETSTIPHTRSEVRRMDQEARQR
jgi:hypothetical protein